jgi:hypothetical protein
LLYLQDEVKPAEVSTEELPAGYRRRFHDIHHLIFPFTSLKQRKAAREPVFRECASRKQVSGNRRQLF